MVDSFFKLKERLIWETKIPPLYGGHFTSGLFTFLNSKWRLDIICTPELRPCYSLNLVPYGDHVSGIGRFVVKTCFINDKVGTKNVFEDQTVFEYTIERRRYTTLWQLSAKDLSNMYPDIQNRGCITIACAFCESNGSILPVTLRTDVTPSSDTDQSPESQNPNPTIRNSPLVDDSLSHDFKDNETTSNNGQSFDLEIPQSTILNTQSNLESLSQDFSKLLNKGFLTDVRLSCGERIFPAHKNILAARSETFSAMFLNEVGENKTDIIDIRDMDASVMEAFLKYLYSGKFDDELPEDIITKLYAAGDKYAVKSLKQICSKCMAENLNEKNFLDFLILSDVHNDKELQSEVAYFVSRHKKLLLEDAWIYFSEIHPRLADKFFTDVHWMST